MSRALLLYGDEALLNEYNKRVAEKQNRKSSTREGKPSQTVGVIRGMEQMVADIETFGPSTNIVIGALFDTKKQFYRLISLLLSDLGMIFNIRTPSPWQVISELEHRRIITVSESANIKVCLSIAKIVLTTGSVSKVRAMFTLSWENLTKVLNVSKKRCNGIIRMKRVLTCCFIAFII